jgi:hypothetical protein
MLLVNRELKIHKIKEMLLRFPTEAAPFIEAKEQESLPIAERLTKAEWCMIHEWLVRVGRQTDEMESGEGAPPFGSST